MAKRRDLKVLDDPLARKYLLRYGRHRAGCAKAYRNPKLDCDCGWQEVKDAIQRMEKK